MHDQPPQRGAAAALVVAPFLVEALQAQHRRILRIVGFESPLLQGLLVELQDGDRQRPGRLGVLLRVEGAFAHRLRVRLLTASAASFIASDSDGWAWQMRAMSSDAALNSIATTASAIISEAIGPMICT